MKTAIVHSEQPVLLVGGGALPEGALNPLLARTGPRVAADGGARALLRAGVTPDAVIGDMDSLTAEDAARIPQERYHRIDEQDSTDFDKCLRNISAPLVLGAGFLGARIDHQLAAMTVLCQRADRRCILVGEDDVVALAPPRLALDLWPGCRVSLFPMAPIRAAGTGLRWPLEGLDFAPHDRVGTSNEAAAAHVEISVPAPHMLVILPPEALDALERGLLTAPDAWPARA
ncbi:thiamine diphosphokinase [Salipiger mucosus]|uniref:thiamine diphosphokinase n=1 Tax=Salipiger mucosus TaxID=263378 RepID=UPI000367E21F|nr:thiamine diphosphokinase [Salipiger mucosus]